MTLEQFLERFAASLGQGWLFTLAVTLAAGIVASAVCPCTLPVGLGIASAAGASEGRSRRAGLAVALAFFGGIVVNLTLLGALAGRLGALATEAFGRYWTLGMATLSLAAAVLAFWGPRLKVQQLAEWRRPGVGGAFGYGFLFSLGTSVAPLLLLLTVSAAAGRPFHGLLLAFTFGLGRGLPFLVVGVLTSALTRFTGLGRYSRAVSLASGCALLVVCGYYINAFVSLL